MLHIALLEYLQPLDVIDALIPAHKAWVQEGYDAGVFLASGPMQPREGGVILAQGERAAFEARCAHDPFVTAGAVRYRFVTFRPRVAVGVLRELTTYT